MNCITNDYPTNNACYLNSGNYDNTLQSTSNFPTIFSYGLICNRVNTGATDKEDIWKF